MNMICVNIRMSVYNSSLITKPMINSFIVVFLLMYLSIGFIWMAVVQ